MQMRHSTSADILLRQVGLEWTDEVMLGDAVVVRGARWWEDEEA
jgi:hypothetical protein